MRVAWAWQAAFALTLLVCHQGRLVQCSAPTVIVGEGATLPNSVYQYATTVYRVENPGVSCVYTPTGSGNGKKRISAGAVDFAGSDSTLASTLYSATPDLQMFPTLATGIVPIYNVPDLTKTLVLTRVALARIFRGNITMWDDPAIIATNPGQNLPSVKIQVVVRSDSSGSTNVFTKALSAFDPDFKAEYSFGDLVPWDFPVIKALGNDGTVANVLIRPYSISYSVLDDAVKSGVPASKLINRMGQIVTPNLLSIRKAVLDNDDKIDSRMNTDLLDSSGPGTWPIATYTYLVLRTQFGQNCHVRRETAIFWLWFYSSDSVAAAAESYGFVTLSEQLRDEVFDKLYTSLICNQTRLVERVFRPQIIGSGAFVLKGIFSMIGRAFAKSSDVKKTHDLVYVPSSNYSTIVEEALNGQVAFAVVPQHSIPSIPLDSMVVMPYSSVSVMIAYNLPEAHNTGLLFNEDAVRAILDGKVCKWNDPLLAQLNPSADLPNANISVVVPIDPAHSSTLAMFSALYPTSAWRQFTPCHPAPKSEAVLSASLLVTPYTFGYIEQYQQSLNLKVAPILFKGNTKPVSPSLSAMYSCVHLGFTHPSCYRFNSVVKIVAKRAYTSSGCDQGLVIAETLQWLMSKKISETALSGSDAVLLPIQGHNVSAITCNGVSMLSPPPPLIHYVERRLSISTSLSLFATVLSSIGCVLAIAVMLFNYYYSDLPYMKMSSPQFNTMIAFGTLLGFMALFVKVYDSYDESVFTFQCNAQLILFCLSFDFCYGGLFVKTYRVFKIFGQRNVQVVKITNQDLFKHMYALVGLDSLFLMIWLAVDPLTMHLEHLTPYRDDSLSSGELTTMILPAEALCTSEYQSELIMVLMVTKSALMIVGSYLSYCTQSVNIAALNDSRQIGLCIYSSSILALVVVPLIRFIHGKPGVLMVMTSCAIWFALVSTLAILFGPKIKIVLSGLSDEYTKTSIDTKQVVKPATPVAVPATQVVTNPITN